MGDHGYYDDDSEPGRMSSDREQLANVREALMNAKELATAEVANLRVALNDAREERDAALRQAETYRLDAQDARIRLAHAREGTTPAFLPAEVCEIEGTVETFPMSDNEIRFECLKLATAIETNYRDGAVTLARAMFDFVKGYGKLPRA